AEVLRTMTVDFGILPYPKMDETQERYYTTVLENVTAMGILTTTKDLEMSGIVMEAMAAYGNKEISPAYYEVALKSKYARDEESAEMLNIIKASTWYDFGYINSTSLGGINSFFQTVVEKDQEIVSYWESQKNVVNAGLESLLEAYRK
ncbi:MAG: hypothetical protein ACI4V1_07030, partial [Eubacteriales bacterium]